MEAVFLFSRQIWGQRYLAVLIDDVRAVHQYPSLLSSRLHFPTLFFSTIPPLSCMCMPDHAG